MIVWWWWPWCYDDAAADNDDEEGEEEEEEEERRRMVMTITITTNQCDYNPYSGTILPYIKGTTNLYGKWEQSLKANEIKDG